MEASRDAKAPAAGGGDLVAALMRKPYRASARSKMGRKNKYTIVVDVGAMTVSFAKKTNTKTFSILQCKSMKTSSKVAKELSLALKADEKAPTYKKVLHFESKAWRDDFYKVFRMALTAGEKASEAFRLLHDEVDKQMTREQEGGGGLTRSTPLAAQH